MNIQIAAFILLITHLVAAGFLYPVLKKQVYLLDAPGTKKIKRLRYTLFAMVVLIFLGNLVPIVIDFGTVFLHLERSSKTLIPISQIYSYTNALTFLLISIMFWFVYRLSNNKVK